VHPNSFAYFNQWLAIKEDYWRALRANSTKLIAILLSKIANLNGDLH
jgi:hypothetical protein